MITKYLLTILLILVGWLVLSRLQGRRAGKRAKPPIMAQETRRCEKCGIYLPVGQPCTCADRT